MKLPSNPRPKRLDEIIDTLPEARRQKVEAEAKALIAESTGSYLSSMYGNSDDDEEAEEVKPKEVPISDVTMSVADKTVVLMIDGKRVTVPSMSYVKALEVTNNRQAREITRMTNQLKNVRERSNTLLKEVNELWAALEKKLDRRDMI